MARITQPSALSDWLPQRHEQIDARQATVRSYRNLPPGWDGYGGGPASDTPIDFGVALLEELRARPDLPLPVVCPIAGGVYIEWQLGDTLLFFEVDAESVLAVGKSRHGETTSEDPTFDVRRAADLTSEFFRDVG